MTKRDFNKLLQHVPQGARLFVEVVGPSHPWQKTLYIQLRCAVPCFPSDLFESGVSVKALLDTALSQEKAAAKAERYLRWLHAENLE